ncbi:MAG: AraC family transcriptional regulator [Wenzhouxiangellaceae bacterium]
MKIELSNAVLMIGMSNGLIVALLLLIQRRWSLAERLLTIFLLLIVARILLYLLGHEGVYDPHSWLYVPPVSISLLYGPFVFIYVYAICFGQLFERWQWHFLPVVLQIVYYVVLLLMPQPSSQQWIQTIHLPVVARAEAALLMLTLPMYLAAAWRLHRRYQQWLLQQISDAEQRQYSWLTLFLLTTTACYGVWLIYTLVSLWQPLTFTLHYFAFAAQSALLIVLAMEAWRQHHLEWPVMAAIQADNVDDKHIAATEQLTRLRAEKWLTMIDQQGWWRDPQLTLAGLARKLETNTTTLSQTLNQGLNENFNSVINRLRIEAICRQLVAAETDQALLNIALDMGFNSKNSFNRNFKRFTGMTPSEYRRLIDKGEGQITQSKTKR